MGHDLMVYSASWILERCEATWALVTSGGAGGAFLIASSAALPLAALASTAFFADIKLRKPKSCQRRPDIARWPLQQD